MHLDSTGPVITNVCGQKRSYYYCLYNPAKQMPACEFLTTCHSATWLSSILEQFGEDAKLMNGRRAVRPRYVVTDFSFALIYAVLHAFNQQSLVDYLKFTFQVFSCLLYGKQVFLTPVVQTTMASFFTDLSVVCQRCHCSIYK